MSLRQAFAQKTGGTSRYATKVASVRSVGRGLPVCSLMSGPWLCCGIAPFSRPRRVGRRDDRSAVHPCHRRRVAYARSANPSTEQVIVCVVASRQRALVPRLDATIPPRRRVFPYRHHRSRRFLHQHARHCRRLAINVKRIFLRLHFVAHEHLHDSLRGAPNMRCA